MILYHIQDISWGGGSYFSAEMHLAYSTSSANCAEEKMIKEIWCVCEL